MKREKYIKLLMALGVSRNDASIKACLCQVTRTPYADDYKRRRPWLQMKKATSQLSDAMRTAGEEIAKVLLIIEHMAKSMQGQLRSYTQDGLRADFVAIDELSQWPKENPHIGGGGNE